MGSTRRTTSSASTSASQTVTECSSDCSTTTAAPTAAPTTDAATATDASSSFPGWAIAVLVLSGVAAIGVVIAVVVYVTNRRDGRAHGADIGGRGQGNYTMNRLDEGLSKAGPT